MMAKRPEGVASGLLRVEAHDRCGLTERGATSGQEAMIDIRSRLAGSELS